MTVSFPYLLSSFHQQAHVNAQSVSFSMIAIGLLFVLLIEKEFIRAYGTTNIRIWLNAIDNFSWTLLGVSAFLIGLRFIGFLLR